MTTSAPPTKTFVRRRAGMSPDSTGKTRWEAVKAAIDTRIAALSFAVVLASSLIVLSAFQAQIDDAINGFVKRTTHEDVEEDSGANDALLRAYVASRPQPGTREIAIVGASYAAGFHEPDPSLRVYSVLQRRLVRETGAAWRVANLASPGYDGWSYFFMSRLLRLRRPPQVMIVSLDVLRPMGRNRHLVLNGGRHLAEFSAAELEPVVARNQQTLFRAEASLLERVRPHTGFLETLTHLRRLARAAAPLLRSVAGRITGRSLDARNELTPEGRRKSWREVPGARAQIEAMRHAPPRVETFGHDTREDLALLGAELAACRKAGIRVIVVVMPRNPAVPFDNRSVHDLLSEWAARHGLEFHDYSRSGIVPDRYFSDTGHFFGQGCAIVADELATLVLAGTTR